MNRGLIIVSSAVVFLFIYIYIVFDINNYKTQIENILSRETNVNVSINGNIDLKFGIKSTIFANDISVTKDGKSLIDAGVFSSQLSIVNILSNKLEINSFSLEDVKFYGINIDETLIKTYNAFAGRNYAMTNTRYSNIKKIDSSGYIKEKILYIEEISIITELLILSGSGKIDFDTNSLSLETISQVRDEESVKGKYNELYPAYLVDTKLPTKFYGDIENPKIDIGYSDVIVNKLKEEIQNRAINSLKDKIIEKLDEEIKIKLPF